MSGQLEKRFNDCNKKIDELFYGIQLNDELQRQMGEIKEYYHKLYIDGLDEESEEECIEIYELFTQALDGVKNGQLKSNEVLNQLEEIKALRKTGLVLENILTALDLLFWASASSLLFAHTVILAPMLVAVNPFFALSVLTIVSLAAICSVVSFFNCIDDFKSSAPVQKEFEREKNLLLFFKPEAPSSETYLSNVSDFDDFQKGCEVSLKTN